MDVLGLDFSVLPTVFRVYRIPRGDERLLFEKLVIADGEVQRARAEHRKREEARRQAEARVKQMAGY